MEHTYNIIIEKGEGDYYTSKVIGLDGCHTQAKSLDELISRTKEAIGFYLEVTAWKIKRLLILWAYKRYNLLAAIRIQLTNRPERTL